VDALGARIQELGGPAALINDQLSPRQQRNLEERWGVPVLDRTEVILSIFARRARSAEGRVQVEMAQLEHQLPRLAGGWAHLERQRGRVGTGGMRGGMGEKQIEVDRRLINQKLRRLRQRLKAIERQRATRRTARTAVPLASCALVGYTNAGKSTLLNRLTDADVLVEDRLFSTLDPTTRQLRLPGGETILASDTVGFVQRLPHQLVESFQSTLEEVVDADLLVHVVDSSFPEAEDQIDAVRKVLREIGADHVPELLVLNKADIAGADDVKLLLTVHPQAVVVSAVTGEGVSVLLDTLAARLRALAPIVEFLVPYERGDVVAALHREGEVLVEVHAEGGSRLRARLPAVAVTRFGEFVVNPRA
jgi:GTP-binding protein HflX